MNTATLYQEIVTMTKKKQRKWVERMRAILLIVGIHIRRMLRISLGGLVIIRR